MILTIDQADEIRQAHYVMDGHADRPKTVAECHDMIEDLLGLLGAVTGITNASAVSPDEVPSPVRMLRRSSPR